MNQIYKFFLAINATSWVVVIYGIKKEWVIMQLPTLVSGIILLLIPIVLSGISVFLTLLLSKDSFRHCCEFEEANSKFLPVYLGYFFIGISIEQFQLLIFLYIIILIFTYVSQTQYFNPIFLLFGYKFYIAKTKSGTNIFIIIRKNIRRADEFNFTNLRRINDTTYIAWREKK